MSKPVPLVQFESDRVVVTTNNPAEVVRAIAALKSGRKQIAERLAELEVEKQNLRQQAQQSRGGGIPYIPGMGKWGRYARIASHLSASGQSESAREGVAQVDAEIQRITSLMQAVDSAVIQLEAKRLAGLL
jgi:septal ring factor EnvC (AmiA/AmiB activator)